MFKMSRCIWYIVCPWRDFFVAIFCCILILLNTRSNIWCLSYGFSTTKNTLNFHLKRPITDTQNSPSKLHCVLFSFTKSFTSWYTQYRYSILVILIQIAESHKQNKCVLRWHPTCFSKIFIAKSVFFNQRYKQKENDISQKKKKLDRLKTTTLGNWRWNLCHWICIKP